MEAVTHVQEASLKPPPTPTPFLTNMRRAALKKGIALFNEENPNAPFDSEHDGGNELELLPIVPTKLLTNAQDSVSICHDVFRQICVPEPASATGSASKITDELLKGIWGEENKARARAMGTVETLYYNCFLAIERLRGFAKIRREEGEKPEAPSEDAVKADIDQELLSDPFHLNWAFEVGVLNVADEMGYQGDKSKWKKAMG